MNSSNKILAPISIGELIDKITILEIKIEKIQDNNKQKYIKHELESLNKLLADINFSKDQRDLVYLTNDKRASLKQKLNQITNSEIVEVKSYKKY